MIISATKAAPKLRFPAISGGWQTVQLSSIAKIYDGTHQTPSYARQGVPFYSVEHVTADDFTSTKFISERVYAQEVKRVVLQRGDILMTRIGDIGTAKYIDWDVRASFYVSLALIKQSDKYNGRFLSQYINTTMFQNELWRRTIHVAFPKKINLGEIGNCTVRLPSLEEQQKIADFLTAVDDKIAVIDKRLKLLKKYKKGAMQKIFTQKIRFKDENGKDFPDWQEKKLNDLLSLGSKQAVEDTSRYKKITVALNKGGVRMTEVSRTMADTRPFYVRKAGEIIIGKQNYFSGSIAVVPDHLSETICSNAIMSFSAKPGYITQFIYEYISRRDFLKRREALANGTGQKELSEKDFLNFELFVPGKPEQQKIADFLAAIDGKIKLEETKLTQAKKFKKTLLQRMFV